MRFRWLSSVASCFGANVSFFIGGVFFLWWRWRRRFRVRAGYGRGGFSVWDGGDAHRRAALGGVRRFSPPVFFW